MVDLAKLKQQDCFLDSKGQVFIVSAVTNSGEVECVQLENADNVVRFPVNTFTEMFTPITALSEDYNIHKDSPLSSALIKTSRIVATLNALLRVTLRAAPQEVRTAAINAIGATKALLQKLVEEVRED